MSDGEQQPVEDAAAAEVKVDMDMDMDMDMHKTAAAAAEVDMHKMAIVAEHIRDHSTHTGVAKIKQITDELTVVPYLDLLTLTPGNPRAKNLLGLVPARFETLTLAEQKLTLHELEKTILTSLTGHLGLYDQITEGTIRYNKLKAIDDREPLTGENRKKLLLSMLYVKKLEARSETHLKTFNVILEWIDVRLGLMLLKAKRDSSHYELKGKLLDLKTKILNAQHSQILYGSTKNSVQAYVKLQIDLSEQISTIRNDIEDFKRTLPKSDEK